MDQQFIPIKNNQIDITKYNNKYFLISFEDNEPIKITGTAKNIIDLIDNQRSVHDIYLHVRKKYNTIDLKKFTTFIDQLIHFNIIVNAGKSDQSKNSIFKKLRFIELLKINTDKYYRYIAEALNGNLLKFMIFISLLLSVIAVMHLYFFGLKYSPSIEMYYTFKKSFYFLYPLIVIYMFVKIFIHESAHALMCRFYGQKVRKMGIALYLLHPVFFTDTTNIWKESNKYKRISVSLAGPVSDFGFIALVYFLNHYVVKDPVLYNYIIIMLYFTVIRSLFNFNPFIKLDGYYILMDMLEIPNLRKKSLNYIKNIIFRKNTGTSISNTQKFIFLTFGILSSVMTVLFIASFLFYIYRMIYR